MTTVRCADSQIQFIFLSATHTGKGSFGVWIGVERNGINDQLEAKKSLNFGKKDSKNSNTLLEKGESVKEPVFCVWERTVSAAAGWDFKWIELRACFCIELYPFRPGATKGRIEN